MQKSESYINRFIEFTFNLEAVQINIENMNFLYVGFFVCFQANAL